MENEAFLLIPFPAIHLSKRILWFSEGLATYVCIYTQYLRCILLVKIIVGIMGPEHASKCYCNASSKGKLAKNCTPKPFPRPE